MGKRALEEKFTKSELVILAWRSQETASALEKMSKDAQEGYSKATREKPQRPWVPDAQIPPGLPEHFFNEEGEVDLRNVTGEEAYRYFSAVGVRLPIIDNR